MRRSKYILFLFLTMMVKGFAQCDPIEYSVFYDSQFTTVPDELQTGEVECYLITPNAGFTVGAIWSNATIDLQNSFQYSYYVNLGTNNADGADGIVFVLSADPAGQAAIGETGGFLSYGGDDGISPSVAVEFDTWDNGPINDDIANDHAMLHYNGIMDGSAGPPIDLGNIEDGVYHLVEVIWDAVDMNLQMNFDGTNIIDEDIDLIGDVFAGNSNVLIGFTGSTGGSANTQIVCDIQVIYTEECNGLDDDCDGIIDEDTEVEIFEDAFICEGEVYEVGMSQYTASGQYMDTLQSALGCDSIIITDLTVGEVFLITNMVSICQGEEYIEGSSVYTTSGSYTDEYQSSQGCDSTIITQLTVHQTYDIEVDATICADEVYVEGSSVYNESGTYVDEYLTSNNCDSIITTQLTVLQIPETSSSYQICEGAAWVTPQGSYSDTGIYNEVYTAINGCDSLVEIQIEILPTSFATQDRFICSGGQFEIGTSIYSEPGQYQDTLVAANGCDSIVTTDLGVIDELVISDSVLCENSSFQLDMNPFPFHDISGFSSIESGVYLFEEGGSFSVEVDLDGCVLSDEFILEFLPIYFNEVYTLTLCEDESIILDGRGIDLDFQWTGGQTSDQITVFQAGEYVKEFNYRCGDFQDRFIIESLNCNCTVFVPTAFSPDGDGVNDYFKVSHGCDFSRFDFNLYDRFGRSVLRSQDPDFQWDGGSAGYYLSPGIFQWTLIYSSVDQRIAKDVFLKGLVTVVR